VMLFLDMDDHFNPPQSESQTDNHKTLCHVIYEAAKKRGSRRIRCILKIVSTSFTISTK
jgi:hypothetical protein